MCAPYSPKKSAEGRSSDIHALLDRYGAKKLSAVDPARYARAAARC